MNGARHPISPVDEMHVLPIDTRLGAACPPLNGGGSSFLMAIVPQDYTCNPIIIPAHNQTVRDVCGALFLAGRAEKWSRGGQPLATDRFGEGGSPSYRVNARLRRLPG